MPKAPKQPAARGPARDPNDISDLMGISKKLLRFKALHTEGRAPTYGSVGAACFDIYHVEGFVRLLPSMSKTFRTGIAIEIPEGKALLIFSRSGHGFKNDVRLANSVAVIDSDYTGELLIRLHNDGAQKLDFEGDARIAQGMLVDAEQWMFEEAPELKTTARGANGGGSTGA